MITSIAHNHTSQPSIQSNQNFFIPHVIERTSAGTERSLDIYTRLTQDRIIFLNTDVNEATANAIIAQLLFLAQNDPDKDINFYISSPGGSVDHGMAIYDTMQMISAKVNTYCVGIAASMGAVLLSGGTGTRYVLPHSRVMIHQPLGGAKGQASDIIIQADEIMKCREELCGILAENCKKSKKELIKDCDRDKYLNSKEALAYGIVDEIMKSGPHARNKIYKS